MYGTPESVTWELLSKTGKTDQLRLEDLVRAVIAGCLFKDGAGLLGPREFVQAVGAGRVVCRVESEGVGVPVEGDDELRVGLPRELILRIAREDCCPGLLVSFLSVCVDEQYYTYAC